MEIRELCPLLTDFRTDSIIDTKDEKVWISYGCVERVDLGVG